MIAGPRFGDYQAAYRFGRLGYDLVEGRGLTRFQARVYNDFGNLVMPWTRHVRAGRDLVRRAFEAANTIGDLTYAAYCGNQLNTKLLFRRMRRPVDAQMPEVVETHGNGAAALIDQLRAFHPDTVVIHPYATSPRRT